MCTFLYLNDRFGMPNWTATVAIIALTKMFGRSVDGLLGLVSERYASRLRKKGELSFLRHVCDVFSPHVGVRREIELATGFRMSKSVQQSKTHPATAIDTAITTSDNAHRVLFAGMRMWPGVPNNHGFQVGLCLSELLLLASILFL